MTKTQDGPEASGHSDPAHIDDRWGGYVPWFLRYAQAPSDGDFDTYFKRVGQRLERLMNFEVALVNVDHFGARLETESLQRFEHRAGFALGPQLRTYFDPRGIREHASFRASRDPEQQRVRTLLVQESLRRDFTPSFPGQVPPGFASEEFLRAEQEAERTQPARMAQHMRVLAAERLGVLEALLKELHITATASLAELIRDLRRSGAEARIPLDIRGDTPRIIPLDERLLQETVIDPLLGRLQACWPERASELLTAYHDVLLGRPLDEVFSSAYKSLEAIARSVTGDGQFEFTQKDLKRHFPQLHPTIYNTCLHLQAHRGDAAAHGRKPPSMSEIRYLLFQICNIALLLFDQERPYSAL